MSDVEDLQYKLKHLCSGMEKARATIEEAGNFLQNARQYLMDLLDGQELHEPATITSVWQAIERLEKDLQKVDELRLELLRDLSRLSG